MQTWFCSGVLPNPTPGSRRMRLNATPALAAMASERSKERSTSSRMSIDGSTVSRLCMTMTAEAVSATASAIPGSRLSPQTSLMTEAPSRAASRATAALLVSTEIGGVDLAAERLENRNNAPKLLFFGHRRMPGPGRFAANVHDRRALGDHGLGARDRGGWDVEMPPAIGKRIGRDVENAHQHRRSSQ